MSVFYKYLLMEARSDYLLQNKKLVEDIWYVLCRELNLELDTQEEQKVKDVKEFLENLEKNKYIAKYLNWVVKQFINVNWRYPEDIDKLEKNLNKFNRSLTYLKNNNQETDLNKYSMNEFNALMNDLPETTRQINQQKEKDIKLNQAQRIYEDSDWILLTPLTQEAAIHYGKGTQWCTAATESRNYFEYYNNRGSLYILINKNNSKEKYQFHLETGSFMNVNDVEVNPDEINAIFNSNQGLKNAILNIIKNSDDIDSTPEITINEETLREFLHKIENEGFELGLPSDSICDLLFDEGVMEFDDWDVAPEDILCSIDTQVMDLLKSYGLDNITNKEQYYKIVDNLFSSGYTESSNKALNTLRKAIITVLNQTDAGNEYGRAKRDALYKDGDEFAKYVMQDLFNNKKIDYYYDCLSFYPTDENFLNNHLCELILNDRTELDKIYLNNIQLPSQGYEYYYDAEPTSDWSDYISEKFIPALKKFLDANPQVIEELKNYNPSEKGEIEKVYFDPYDDNGYAEEFNPIPKKTEK